MSITLVPLARDTYTYLAAVPCSLPSAWPAADPALGAAVMLECDPEEPSGYPPSGAQIWPTDLLQIAADLQLAVEEVEGAPIASRELVEQEQIVWHYLTLAFTGEPPSRPAVWSELRETMLATLLPERWNAPAECRAILCFSEADYAVLLTPDAQLQQRWLAWMLRTSIPDLADGLAISAAADHALAEWILANSGGQGCCIKAVEFGGARSGPLVVRVAGHWGRDPSVPLTAGQPKGEWFNLVLHLPHPSAAEHIAAGDVRPGTAPE